MSRRTEIGYEARATGASEQVIAKLPWPKGPCVNPAVVWGRSVFLPGEISPQALTGHVFTHAEREVSSGHSSEVSAP